MLPSLGDGEMWLGITFIEGEVKGLVGKNSEVWADGIAFLVNKKSVLKKNFQDEQNLDSEIYEELEIKKGPDHGELWKVSQRGWTLFPNSYTDL